VGGRQTEKAAVGSSAPRVAITPYRRPDGRGTGTHAIRSPARHRPRRHN
jgi:hypothetical protein